ncbi:hypothetical protein [Amphritea opalescens]|uniref:hypothetical protein n=1 Tax=Amphritea opalescens TaxID=2490544 RepID=UPI0030B9B891
MTATTVTLQAVDRVLLKTPIAFGSHLPALGTPIKWVSEQLPIMSEGSIKLKIYEPGKLVGAIDATEFSQPAIDQRLGLYKIAKYNYFPCWHQQATIFELLINKDTWKGMSKSQQAIVDNTCKASVTNAVA